MNAAWSRFVEVNGRIVPAARAAVSVYDRGLLYGDGLFETLRAYGGVPFGLDEHLARLQASARVLGIVLPRKAWVRSVRTVLARNRLTRADAWVRISVTRGVGAPGPLPVACARPTVIVSVGVLDRTIAAAQRRGVRVALLPFARHGFLAEHKVLNFLPSVLGKVMAARHRALEGLFVDARGYVTEGTTSNLFIWRGGRLCTPPLTGILPGITRRMILDAAHADGLRAVERPIRSSDLLDAEEAFLTSSLAEVLPVTMVNARAVGAGTVGPVTRRVHRLYRRTVDRALGRCSLD